MAKKKATFEEALNRLEEIVSEMENSKTSLEKSISLYKEGMDISVFCSNSLSQIESQVKILKDIKPI